MLERHTEGKTHAEGRNHEVADVINGAEALRQKEEHRKLVVSGRNNKNNDQKQ